MIQKNVIPLMAYAASPRKWVKQLYERGGVTYFSDNARVFNVVDHAGQHLYKKNIGDWAWGTDQKIRIPVNREKSLHIKLNMCRLLAVQEPQITLYAGEWPEVLAHLDDYDLIRNREWPNKAGAIWMPRGLGSSWSGFIQAVNNQLNDAPFTDIGAYKSSEKYKPVFDKYGDRLKKLLEVEYF